MRLSRIHAAFVLALSIAAAGCGGEDPKGSAEPTPTGTPEPSTRLHPLDVGFSWTYRVTDLESGAESTKTRTIEALEDIGDRKAGIEGYRMRVENANGYSLSWHEDLGENVGVVRHREKSFEGNVLERDEYYDVHKLRVSEAPEHRTAGATWTETYTETHIEPGVPEESELETRNWTVEAEAEEVTVPAGTFQALRVRRASPLGGSDKVLWLVEGIGVVREIDAIEAEEIQLVTWDPVE